jgi:hypothetical protein
MSHPLQIGQMTFNPMLPALYGRKVSDRRETVCSFLNRTEIAAGVTLLTGYALAKRGVPSACGAIDS